MRRQSLIVVSSMLLLSSLSCRRGEVVEPQEGAVMPTKTIQQVQEEHTDKWMAIPGVVGTAVGQDKGRPCILVFTASNTEQVRQKIPLMVEGYPVVVQHMGEVRALDKQ